MPTPWAMRLDVIYGLILTATQSQIQEKGHNRLPSWLIPENINQAVARVYLILSFNTKKWPHTTQHPSEKTSLNKHGFWWWTSKKCWLIRPIFLIKLVYGMWSWLKHKNVFRKVNYFCPFRSVQLGQLDHFVYLRPTKFVYKCPTNNVTNMSAYWLLLHGERPINIMAELFL